MNKCDVMTKNNDVQPSEKRMKSETRRDCFVVFAYKICVFSNYSTFWIMSRLGYSFIGTGLQAFPENARTQQAKLTF